MNTETLGQAEREWVEELAHSWVEVYKKSATTLVLLRHIRAAGPVSVGDVREHFLASTGWSISERGLYRTLKRLADSGLLVTTQTSVPGTGARRKDFALSSAGHAYLTIIETEVI